MLRSSSGKAVSVRDWGGIHPANEKPPSSLVESGGPPVRPPNRPYHAGNIARSAGRNKVTECVDVSSVNGIEPPRTFSANRPGLVRLPKSNIVF